VSITEPQHFLQCFTPIVTPMHVAATDSVMLPQGVLTSTYHTSCDSFTS